MNHCQPTIIDHHWYLYYQQLGIHLNSDHATSKSCTLSIPNSSSPNPKERCFLCCLVGPRSSPVSRTHWEDHGPSTGAPVPWCTQGMPSAQPRRQALPEILTAIATVDCTPSSLVCGRSQGVPQGGSWQRSSVSHGLSMLIDVSICIILYYIYICIVYICLLYIYMSIPGISIIRQPIGASPTTSNHRRSHCHCMSTSQPACTVAFATNRSPRSFCCQRSNLHTWPSHFQGLLTVPLSTSIQLCYQWCGRDPGTHVPWYFWFILSWQNYMGSARQVKLLRCVIHVHLIHLAPDTPKWG